MIRYALACTAGHSFDAWFRSSGDFDRQRERRLVTCPACGGTSVDKALMAPAVRVRDQVPTPPEAPVPAASPPAALPAAPVPQALIPPEAQAVVEKMRALKAEILKSSEDVGPRFVEEARRIHYGEAPERPVHGQASLDDARALAEEGIPVLPLPVLPDERN